MGTIIEAIAAENVANSTNASTKITPALRQGESDLKKIHKERNERFKSNTVNADKVELCGVTDAGTTSFTPQEVSDLKEILKKRNDGTKPDVTQASKIGLCGVSVTGTASFTPYWTPKIIQEVGKKESSKTGGVFSFAIKFTKEFENSANSKIEACLKGGKGSGVSTNLTYAKINSDEDQVVDGKGNALVKLKELYYQQSLFNNKVIVDFGMLSFFSFFAKNECSRFITGTFSEDKTIYSVSKSIALRLSYALLDEVDVSYGYFANDIDNINVKCVNVVQVAYKPFKNGTIRAYGWVNNGDFYSFKDKSKSGTYGFGISADQKMTKAVGGFLRFGYTDPSVGVYRKGANNDSKVNNKFEYPMTMMWSVGIQVNGIAWSRDKDLVGLAVGQAYGSSDAKKCKAIDKYKDGAETEVELYYRVALNKYVTLSPVIQYIANPKGGNGPCDNDIWIFGIRTQLAF
jgi:hypothetical protein